MKPKQRCPGTLRCSQYSCKRSGVKCTLSHCKSCSKRACRYTTVSLNTPSSQEVLRPNIYYYIEQSFRSERLPCFPASDDPCCHVSRILEQSHGTSASERYCGATANYIMVEQSHGTSVSERIEEQSHGTSVSERIEETFISCFIVVSILQTSLWRF
jgi:hypothetical protein